MTIRSFLAAFTVGLFLSTGHSGVALAHSEHLKTLSITGLWARATPPRAQAAGGFLTIENTGTETDRLVDANSPIAGRVEIHEMAMNDGVMTMRALTEGIEIPAGDSITLAPGGVHIMFMDLKDGFTEGSPVAMTLVFENAGEIEVSLPVLGLGAKGPSMKVMEHDHGTSDTGSKQ